MIKCLLRHFNAAKFMKDIKQPSAGEAELTFRVITTGSRPVRLSVGHHAGLNSVCVCVHCAFPPQPAVV